MPMARRKLKRPTYGDQSGGTTIGGRPVPPRPDPTGLGPGFHANPKTGVPESGGWYFNKDTWQHEAKPTAYDAPQVDDPAELARNKQMRELSYTVDPKKHAIMAEAARKTGRAMPYQFNAEMTGVDPAVQAKVKTKAAKKLTGDRIRADLMRPGGPQGTVTTGPGRVPSYNNSAIPGFDDPSVAGDVMAQRRAYAQSIGQGGGPTAPPPTGGGTKPPTSGGGVKPPVGIQPPPGGGGPTTPPPGGGPTTPPPGGTPPGGGFPRPPYTPGPIGQPGQPFGMVMGQPMPRPDMQNAMASLGGFGMNPYAQMAQMFGPQMGGGRFGPSGTESLGSRLPPQLGMGMGNPFGGGMPYSQLMSGITGMGAGFGPSGMESLGSRLPPGMVGSRDMTPMLQGPSSLGMGAGNPFDMGMSDPWSQQRMFLAQGMSPWGTY